MKRILLIIFTTICLSTVYAVNRDINIALLADLHITPGNNNDKIMRELVDDINRAKYDLVIVAGDLTNMGTFDELKCAYDHLKRIKHRKLITHGNHETTWSPSAGKDFEKLWGHNGCTTARVLDYLFVAFPAGPFIKMADGTAQDGARLQWVESRLKKGKAGKIISVCHYPLNADLTNREQVVELMKRYGVSASLCGHYHKPRLMNFDSLPGIVGRSLMLKTAAGPNYGYSKLTISGDSIHIAEKLIGKDAVHCYSIRQVCDSTINSIAPSPATEPIDLSNFEAQCVVTDNAAIYTAAQVVDGVLYYANSAGQVKAYDTNSEQFIWIRKFRDPIYSTPIISDDKVIVPTLSEGIVALSRNRGKRIWCNRDGDRFIGNGTVDNGHIYIGAQGKMFKIDCSSGRTVWCYAFGEAHPQAQPTVSAGRLIFGAWDCNLYCVDCQSGRELWRWSNGSKNRLYSPGNVIARVAQDRVMIVAPDRYMTCIDLNSGAQLWRVKQRRVRESTGISNDGKIFYSKTMDGQMIAIPTDADSYNELWFSDVGWGYDHSFCPLIESDNIIYMSNRRGKVAAVSSSGELVGVAKLANSAANDLRADSSGTIWASFIEGTIWRLKAK